MGLDDLFVNNPIKKEPPSEDITIEGSFDCQQCGHETEIAQLREGNIWWVCSECNFRSVAGGLG